MPVPVGTVASTVPTGFHARAIGVVADSAGPEGGSLT